MLGAVTAIGGSKLDYPVERAQAKIRKAGLPAGLAVRLAAGE